MRDVSIIGIGQTIVGEHWDKSLRELGYYALAAALKDAKLARVDALYVGNAHSGALSNQENVGAMIADFAGLRGVEALKIEAAGASAAAAMRLGYIAVAGGLCDFVACVGVEKMTDQQPSTQESALAMSADGYDNSKRMRPGFTTATQNSGLPLPEPMRVSAGFFVTGLSGNTLIQTLPPRLMWRVMAIRAASI